MINTKEALLEFISDNASLNVVIKEEDSLKDDLGLDDLDVIELVMNLEEEFNISIDDSVTDNLTTVQSIIDYLQSQNITLK